MARRDAGDGGRQAFIDAAAIALFAAGWPQKTLWQRAEHLWQTRQDHLRETARPKSLQPVEPVR